MVWEWVIFESRSVNSDLNRWKNNRRATIVQNPCYFNAKQVNERCLSHHIATPTFNLVSGSEASSPDVLFSSTGSGEARLVVWRPGDTGRTAAHLLLLTSVTFLDWGKCGTKQGRTTADRSLSPLTYCNVLWQPARASPSILVSYDINILEPSQEGLRPQCWSWLFLERIFLYPFAKLICHVHQCLHVYMYIWNFTRNLFNFENTLDVRFEKNNF